MFKILNQAINAATGCLEAKKNILYPTDTVWGLGCDATSEAAVKNIFRIKKRDDQKALICLMKDLEMISNYIEKLPPNIKAIMQQTQEPLTIIYPNAKGLASNLLPPDGSIAIRIPNDDFCQKLLQAFGKPIVSTSANISGTPTPSCFAEIDPEILEQVDYVVPLNQEKISGKPSKIIKIEPDGSFLTIRA